MPTGTLRPDGTISSTAATAVGGTGTLHGVTSDNVDASYIQMPPGAQVLLDLDTVTLSTGKIVVSWTPVIRLNATGGSAIYAEIWKSGGALALYGPFNGTAQNTYTGGTVSIGTAGQISTQAHVDALQARIFQSGSANANILELSWNINWANPPQAPSITAVPTTTLRPTVSWTYNAGTDSTGGQTGYLVKVFNSVQYGAGGFDPLTSTAAFEAINLNSNLTNVLVNVTLQNKLAHRAYVWTYATDGGVQRTNVTATFATFTPNVTVPVPTALTPADASTVASNTPTVNASSAANVDYLLTRREWEIDSSSSFAGANYRTFVDPAGFQNGSSTPVAWPSTVARIFQRNWKIRARCVDQFGNAGQWTNQVTTITSFDVVHPSTSTAHTPAGGNTVEYTGTATVNWVFSDAYAQDNQTKYQVLLWRLEDPTGTIRDSGLQTSSALTRAFSGLSTNWKDKEIRWKVATYDQDNATQGYSPELAFFMSDAPSVAITAPTTASVVSTSQPTITWTFSGSRSRTQAQWKVDIYNTAGAGTLLATSGWQLGADTSWHVPVPTVSVGPTFSSVVTVIDSFGLTNTVTTTWTSNYDAPTTPTFTLSGTTYPTTGLNYLDWSGATVDGTFSAWRVYRRLVGDVPWTLLAEYTAVTTRTYSDYTAPSTYPVEYTIVQAINNFGVTIESGYSTKTTVGTLLHYMLLVPGDPTLNLPLYSTSAETFSDEQDIEVIKIIGRGRRIEYGTRYGINGSLTAKLRNQTGMTARTQRLRIEAMRRSGLQVILSNPFGDIYKVGLMSAEVTRDAGMGMHEAATVAISYSEISAIPIPLQVLPPTVDPPDEPDPDEIDPATLMPVNGILYGAATSSLDGTFNYTTGLAEIEAIIGRSLDLQHFYQKNTDQFFTSSDIGRLERVGKPRSICIYNWKVSTTDTWADIAGGSQDANLSARALEMIAYPHKFHLIINHEPENDANYGAAGYTAADYVAMFRYVVTFLRGEGVTNAVFGWCMTGFSSHRNKYDVLYPGDDVVDVIWYDPYAHSGATDLDNFLDEHQTTSGYTGSNSPYRGFYTWATLKAPGKPIALGEWGMGGDCTVANTILDAVTKTKMDADYPMLKTWVFWYDTDKANNEKQTITMSGSVTAGSFPFVWNGQSVILNWNSTASQAQTGIRSMTNVGTPRVVVTGGPLPGTPLVVEFRDTLRGANQPLATTNSTSLVGGGTVAITTTQGGSSANNYYPQLVPTGSTRPSDYVDHFIALAMRDLFNITPTSLAP